MHDVRRSVDLFLKISTFHAHIPGCVFLHVYTLQFTRSLLTHLHDSQAPWPKSFRFACVRKKCVAHLFDTDTEHTRVPQLWHTSASSKRVQIVTRNRRIVHMERKPSTRCVSSVVWRWLIVASVPQWSRLTEQQTTTCSLVQQQFEVHIATNTWPQRRHFRSGYSGGGDVLLNRDRWQLHGAPSKSSTTNGSVRALFGSTTGWTWNKVHNSTNKTATEWKMRWKWRVHDVRNGCASQHREHWMRNSRKNTYNPAQNDYRQGSLVFDLIETVIFVIWLPD